jgi:hypothetical protein
MTTTLLNSLGRVSRKTTSSAPSQFLPFLHEPPSSPPNLAFTGFLWITLRPNSTSVSRHIAVMRSRSRPFARYDSTSHTKPLTPMSDSASWQVIQQSLGQQVSMPVAQIVAGFTKVFVGEIVEKGNRRPSYHHHVAISNLIASSARSSGSPGAPRRKGPLVS